VVLAISNQSPQIFYVRLLNLSLTAKNLDLKKFFRDESFLLKLFFLIAKLDKV